MQSAVYAIGRRKFHQIRCSPCVLFLVSGGVPAIEEMPWCPKAVSLKDGEGWQQRATFRSRLIYNREAERPSRA